MKYKFLGSRTFPEGILPPLKIVSTEIFLNNVIYFIKFSLRIKFQPISRVIEIYNLIRKYIPIIIRPRSAANGNVIRNNVMQFIHKFSKIFFSGTEKAGMDQFKQGNGVSLGQQLIKNHTLPSLNRKTVNKKCPDLTDC